MPLPRITLISGIPYKKNKSIVHMTYRNSPRVEITITTEMIIMFALFVQFTVVNKGYVCFPIHIPIQTCIWFALSFVYSKIG